jgi:hypothetical protein
VSDTWADTEIVTITKLHTQLRDRMRDMWHEKAYVEFTAPVATGAILPNYTLVVSSGALTYEAVPHEVEFFSPYIQVDPTLVSHYALFDDTVNMGVLGVHGDTWTTDISPGYFTRKLFPTAGTHTFKVMTGASAAGTFTTGAGVGGTNTVLPGYIRIMAKGGE